MIYKYEIRNNGKEDILYIYMSLQYEFSKEFLYEDDSINVSTRNFINSNGIKFRGNSVYLVVDGKIVRKMNLSDIMDNDKEYLADKFMVNISLDDNSMCEISLREYLLGVLLSKYMVNLDKETLKAMTVLYTTFVFKMMEDNNCVLANNRFAIYKPYDYYKIDMINFQGIINTLNEIIESVDGVYLSYNDSYILPFMHYSNSGKTLTNKNYPYLSNVKSLWDLASPYYIDIKDYKFEDLNSKLKIQIDSSSDINIINDNYKKIKLGQSIFSLQELKAILDLKSDDIYIIVNNNNLRFITKGWGNSYGLSIFGSCEIAKNGCNYSNILKYYFPKTKLCEKELE